MLHILRLASIRRVALSALAAASLLSGAACSHTRLDDSFGIRNREIFRVQTAQRTPRDIVNSGQAAEGAMAKYYQKQAPGENGSSGGAAQSPATSLKIPGLQH
jgi:hypothetical protein